MLVYVVLCFQLRREQEEEPFAGEFELEPDVRAGPNNNSILKSFFSLPHWPPSSLLSSPLVDDNDSALGSRS